MLRTACLSLLLALCASLASAEHPVPFDVKLLYVDANEGCDIADVDGDGKLDVIAGRNWFQNPDWTPRPLRQFEDWNGYVTSNGDFTWDVNGDGRVDVIAGSFLPTAVYWYENPGEEALKLGQLWPQHMLVDTGLSANEASFLHDIDGDGTPEWITDSWNPANPMIIWSLGTREETQTVKQGNEELRREIQRPALQRHLIGEQGNGHGMAFGDINNDGREDILVGTGWHERPEGDPLNEPWRFHEVWNLHSSCPMLVRDLDGDGINDLIWAKGHDYGLYLWKGKGPDESGKLQFEEQVIDDSFSQAHALHFADLDGDGRDELITGKRVRAHNGNDPGGKEPPLVCYYTWDEGSTKFTRHMIEKGTVGIGLQIRTADIDADGDIDIVVAGKDGTQILFNRRK